MFSFKTLLFQLAVLVVLVSAQRPSHKMPTITRTTFVPEAPVLPDEFTAAITYHLTSEYQDYFVDGYYYYSDMVEAVQIDYTYPGSFGTELVQGNVITVGTFTGGEISCFNTTAQVPFLPPTILQTFQFLGTSISPTGEMLYAWGEELTPGYDLIVFTDAQSGALVAEFTEDFSLQYLSFVEGVPSTVFQEKCGATASNIAMPRDHTAPRSFLVGNA